MVYALTQKHLHIKKSISVPLKNSHKIALNWWEPGLCSGADTPFIQNGKRNWLLFEGKKKKIQGSFQK